MSTVELISATELLRDVKRGVRSLDEAIALINTASIEEEQTTKLEKTIERLEHERDEQDDLRADARHEGEDDAYARACELLRDAGRGILTFDEVAAELSRGRRHHPEFFGRHR